MSSKSVITMHRLPPTIACLSNRRRKSIHDLARLILLPTYISAKRRRRTNTRSVYTFKKDSTQPRLAAILHQTKRSSMRALAFSVLLLSCSCHLSPKGERSPCASTSSFHRVQVYILWHQACITASLSCHMPFMQFAAPSDNQSLLGQNACSREFRRADHLAGELRTLLLRNLPSTSRYL